MSQKDKQAVEEAAVAVEEAKTEQAEAQAKEAEPLKAEKEKKEKKPCWLLNAKSVGGVILRIFLFFAGAYCYLLLCGLIFDKWLKMYNMTTFIFISFCALVLLALVLSVVVVVRYAKRKKA